MPCTILGIVIARVMIVFMTVQNPDPLMLLRIPHRKKGNRTFWGSVHLGLGGDTALGVGDLDTESLGLLDDLDTLAGRDGVGNPARWVSFGSSL
jgi:hypothetical protein